ISAEDYAHKLEEACAFLRGELPGYLKELHEEMERASGEMDFERAAALRDTLFFLKKTIKAKTRISSTPEMKREQGKRAVRELKRILGMPTIPHTIEAYDVSNISGTYSVASMVCFVDGMPYRTRYRRFRIKTVEGINDVGMMAEVIRRRFSRLKKEKGKRPGLVLVDGGMNQLHATRVELAYLDIHNVATAGLAKRFEELYFEEGKPPIQLARDSCALRMLQRLRDEAHRFAITYHRALRNRCIKESFLDDIHGIGKKRKQLILAHFGSVRRLGKASPEDIAKVPGIGYEIAVSICNALLKKGDGKNSP
ncbi:MAG: UvrB/UvrC motif-containing protein, partial [Kiritimatiellae bacterium]|nr:UvrB/UvrC motif-containing protein [Kiritimatiellia bacterium]